MDIGDKSRKEGKEIAKLYIEDHLQMQTFEAENQGVGLVMSMLGKVTAGELRVSNEIIPHSKQSLLWKPVLSSW